MSTEAAVGVQPTPGSGGNRPSSSSRRSTPESETGDLVTILAAHWHLGYRPSDKVRVDTFT